MKQYITIKQLNELSESGRRKLHEWEVKKGYDNGIHDGLSLKVLSIGQMIEFLEEHLPNQIAGWKEDQPYSFHWEPGKICDNLWDCVKSVLES